MLKIKLPKIIKKQSRKNTGREKREFELIYLKHHRRIYSLCLRMTQSAALAEDLTRKIFVDFFRNSSNFNGRSDLKISILRLAVDHLNSIRLDGRLANAASKNRIHQAKSEILTAILKEEN